MVPENIFIAAAPPIPGFHAAPVLETKNIGTCDLYILIDADRVDMILKERRTSKLLALETIPFPFTGKTGWRQVLEQISSTSRILRGFEFSKVKVAIGSEKFTLVPDALFKPGDEKIYLEKNFALSSDDIIRTRHIPGYHLYSLFCIDPELDKELSHLFQDPEILHHSQTFLSGINVLPKSASEKNIFLNINPKRIDIVVSENKKLILLNSFSWKTNEDILYYVLFVCEQLSLNPESVNLNISGEAEADGQLYNLLYTYIRRISFCSKPAGMQLEYSGTNNFHRHALVYYLTLCE